jgi:hypothetical protein
MVSAQAPMHFKIIPISMLENRIENCPIKSKKFAKYLIVVSGCRYFYLNTGQYLFKD